MSAKEIYIRLREYGMTPAGACAMLGNMQAESGLKSEIVQLGMTSLSDEDYTHRANSGAVDFVHDGIGYGLCQWTFWSRKHGLLEFAKSRGVSVGNEAMQVEYAVKELKTGYSTLWDYLCSTEAVATATAEICTKFEWPAVLNISRRIEYADQNFALAEAEGWESAVHNEDISEDKPTTPFWPPRVLCEGMVGSDVSVLQALLQAHGYNTAITGVFDSKTKCMVLAFQGERGLATDGIAGAKTFKALGVSM